MYLSVAGLFPLRETDQGGRINRYGVNEECVPQV